MPMPRSCWSKWVTWCCVVQRSPTSAIPAALLAPICTSRCDTEALRRTPHAFYECPADTNNCRARGEGREGPRPSCFGGTEETFAPLAFGGRGSHLTWPEWLET